MQGRRGMGFRIRGASPPPPFIGRGRGGLPRCYFFLWQQGLLPDMDSFPQPGQMAPPVPQKDFGDREQELEALKRALQNLEKQKEDIKKRIEELKK